MGNMNSIVRPRYVILIKKRKYILTGGGNNDLKFESLKNIRTGKASPMIKTYYTPSIAWKGIRDKKWIMQYNPEIYEVVEKVAFRRCCGEYEYLKNGDMIIRDDEIVIKEKPVKPVKQKIVKEKKLKPDEEWDD